MKHGLFTLLATSAVLTFSAPQSSAAKADTYSAIRTGTIASVEHLLKNGVSVEDRDANGDTLLMRATIYGTPGVVKFLIDKGADVNATNKAGATALMRAAGSFAKTKLLVDKGASVNARSALGNTPLMLAARPYGSADAVKLLLSHGADVHATNSFGATAITTAAASGDLDTVQLLLSHGADPNTHSRGSEANVIWGGGRSPLMWAAYRGDLPMIKFLLKAGAKVNESEGFGSALIQAAWADQLEAARLLIQNGADVNQKDFQSGYTALHWAASSERNNSALVDLLVKNGADINGEGGQEIDAFLGIGQTPLMLAQKRGQTASTTLLRASGATANASSEKALARGQHELPKGVDHETLRRALTQSIPPLEQTAITSKESFLNHGSKQNCVSCHQQYLPMTASGFAQRAGLTLNKTAEDEILTMVKRDNQGLEAITTETTFHPEPGHGYGYALFALETQKQPADSQIDAAIHHLLVVQGKEGQWFNNLPRPPIQTSDVAPTALAIKALSTYGFPAQKKEIEQRIARARAWLWKVQPANTEERVYQLLGLAWAGENAKSLQKLASALLKEQRADGGWAQLEKLQSDAYATGSALFSLHAAGISAGTPEFKKGLEYLVKTQLDDGTWHVARRAFPFQPTMRSGFPHSRDSWISATGTSWAAMALAVSLEEKPLQVSLSK